MLKSFRALMGLGIPLFAAVAVLMPAETVVAQGKKAAPATTADMQLAGAIQTLRVARATLNAADHDYGGHRAEAVQDITAAIKQLRLSLEAVHQAKLIPKGEKGKENKGGNNEPQAISDAQLAAQIPTLEQTATALKNATIDYGGHRTQAVTDLQAAVAQLKKALKYSKEKNQEK